MAAAHQCFEAVDRHATNCSDLRSPDHSHQILCDVSLGTRGSSPPHGVAAAGDRDVQRFMGDGVVDENMGRVDGAAFARAVVVA